MFEEDWEQPMPDLPEPPPPTSQNMEAVATHEEYVLKDEKTFISNVSNFFNQESLSDISLVVGNDKYYGHKFVLAKSSDVFRTMLYSSQWKQENIHEVNLNESPECQTVFNRFLRYLYTAEISINTESAVGILCLADKYNVASLKSLCTKYMVEYTKSPKVQNALNWYSWAKALNMDDLKEQCSKTIAWNADAIIASTEWPSMDIDFVLDIIQNSALIICNEYALYLALKSWMLHASHFDNLEKNAQMLLPCIHFPQMMVQQLYEVENSDMAKREECSELINQLISKAYRFRSLCPAQKDLDVSFDEPFYMPRNYKNLVVDNVRMQNTLRFGIQVDVRTYVGPVPSDFKEGDWKITYRKNGDSWLMQIYSHESALIQGETRMIGSVIVFNGDEKVIQIEESVTTVCSRTSSVSLVVNVTSPEEAKTMAVLIKPIPF